MDNLNERAFLEKLKNGEDGTFDLFFKQMAPYLCSFIMKNYGLNKHDSEELAADALFKVHSSLKSYTPGRAKFTTWVLTITKNTVIDVLRKKTREEKKFPVEWLAEDSAKAFFASDNDGECLTPNIARLVRAMGKLSESNQEILRLKQSMTYEEISECEKVSVGALRVRYSRAVDELRAAYLQENNNER